MCGQEQEGRTSPIMMFARLPPTRHLTESIPRNAGEESAGLLQEHSNTFFYLVWMLNPACGVEARRAEPQTCQRLPNHIKEAHYVS